MEKIHCICVMRDLLSALTELECNLADNYELSLNEAMILCCIGDERMTATSISHNVGLLPPHTSKTLRSIEKKGFVKRSLGTKDKRQMYFKLTPAGKEVLERLRENGVEVPDLLKSFF